MTSAQWTFSTTCTNKYVRKRKRSYFLFCCRYNNWLCGWGNFFVEADDKEIGYVYSRFFFQASFATTATTIVSGKICWVRQYQVSDIDLLGRNDAEQGAIYPATAASGGGHIVFDCFRRVERHQRKIIYVQFPLATLVADSVYILWQINRKTSWRIPQRIRPYSLSRSHGCAQPVGMLSFESNTQK